MNHQNEIRIKAGHLYQACVDRNICGNCPFRGWKTNTCRRFWKPIKRINQSNGGFHHIPCTECLAHVLTKFDINYLKR